MIVALIVCRRFVLQARVYARDVCGGVFDVFACVVLNLCVCVGLIVWVCVCSVDYLCVCVCQCVPFCVCPTYLWVLW